MLSVICVFGTDATHVLDLRGLCSNRKVRALFSIMSVLGCLMHRPADRQFRGLDARYFVSSYLYGVPYLESLGHVGDDLAVIQIPSGNRVVTDYSPVVGSRLTLRITSPCWPLGGPALSSAY
jgi:hypothetical protein